MIAYIAYTFTNYGLSIYGVYSSLVKAKAAFPGVWTAHGDSRWWQNPEHAWPVYLEPVTMDNQLEEWVLQDGR